MPGRASPIAAWSWVMLWSAEWQGAPEIGDQRPAVAIEQVGGGAGKLAELLGGVAGLADRDPRLGERRRDLGPAVGERSADLLEMVEDAGDRLLVAVGKQFGEPLGQRREPFEQLRRGVEQLRRARPAWSGSPARHRGIPIADSSGRQVACGGARWPGAALGRIELDLGDAGEADAADGRGRALRAPASRR